MAQSIIELEASWTKAVYCADPEHDELQPTEYSKLIRSFTGNG